MKAVWINIYEAIAHNKKTMASNDKKRMSLERETFILQLIAESRF